MQLLHPGKAGQQTWQAWLLICLLASGIQALSHGFDPRLQQDEVQIVDFGRVALQPESDWALTWYVAGEAAMMPMGYLGPVLQELAFRVSHPTHNGPRLLALFGALLAASCLLGWLLARGTPSTAALILASGFLLDPAFSTTYREGRVDGLAIASGLLACWLCRSAISNHLKGIQRPLLVPMAGAFLVAAPFFWPSAFMLAPLVMLEFLCLLRAKVPPAGKLVSAPLISTSLAFATGGVIAASFLLMPMILNWAEYYDSFQFAAAVQKHSAMLQSSFFDLVAVYDPIIAIAAVLALLYKRDYGLLIVTGLALGVMVQTRVYPARIIYLLPYVFAIVAAAATVAWEGGRPAIHKAIMVRLLAVLMIWNVGLVLVLRPVVAYQKEASSNVDYHLPALESAIGAGPYRVLLENWASYYAARNLGWKIYRPGTLYPGPTYMDFLRTMDFVIVQEHSKSDVTKRLIEADAGFELQETLVFPDAENRIISWGPIRIPVIQNNYPALLVYRKIKQ